MARYIDADKEIIGLKYALARVEPTETTKIMVGEVIKMLEQAPTADVVEVVRCKDCKYNTFEQANNIIHCSRDRKYGTMFFKPNDFCSYGERKGE